MNTETRWETNLAYYRASRAYNNGGSRREEALNNPPALANGEADSIDCPTEADRIVCPTEHPALITAAATCLKWLIIFCYSLFIALALAILCLHFFPCLPKAHSLFP